MLIVLRHAVAVLLLLACGSVSATETKFEPDDELAGNARKWAQEFVTFAAERYQEELDWSQVSIKSIDDIVNDLHKTYVTEKPAEEAVAPIARALGSYVAEVYRIFNGGKWGWVVMETGSYPGIQAESGATFLPMKKALDRITTGESPDIWEYFQILSEH